MEDKRKTKKQMIEELNELRQSLSELKGFAEEVKQARVNQEKFTKAFQQNSIPTIITTAKDGRVVEVSDAFLRLVGLKRHEVIGHTSTEGAFITKEQRSYFFNELKKSGRVENLEMEIRPQSGTLRYGLFNAVMMSINNENCLLTTIQNITESKNADAVLLEIKECYKALFDRSLDCVYIHDSAGNFLDANNAALNLLGYKREELSSLNFAALLSDDQMPLALQTLQEIIDTGYQKNVTGYRMKRKNGDVVYVETIGASILRGGNPYAIQGIARDITDRKQIETQNRQHQKSESLTRMAGAIAHHFNNQLGAVIGNLELAIGELPKGAATAKRLTKAMQSAWKAADMSGLMLTYLGQSRDKREPLDISYVCLQSLPILRIAIPENVTLKTDFPSAGPIIMANSSEIQQVLTNLITNAREAIGDSRGTILLNVKIVSPAEIPTVHRHPIDWQPQVNLYACLEVTDTGCGIEHKDIEKLFDPFFTDKFTGRGMGLAIVLGIVKGHNGLNTVESEPGLGSTFRIFLPVHEDALPQTKTTENDRDVTISAPSPVTMEESGTVLIVEDEELLRDMAAAMLESFGFSVLKAKDGIEALEIFCKHQSEIKFVISDLSMPRMNGWETLTELRKLQPNIPVILASGYDLAHVMEGDHPELPQAFLAKPYNLTALSNAIRQTLEKGKAAYNGKDDHNESII